MGQASRLRAGLLSADGVLSRRLARFAGRLSGGSDARFWTLGVRAAETVLRRATQKRRRHRVPAQTTGDER